MSHLFKKPNTLENVDLLQVCVEKLKANKNVTVYVGTDSKNTDRKTRYITSVVFRGGNWGCSFVYNEVLLPKKKDLFERLFHECKLSLDIADYLKEKSSIQIEAIELDYNNYKKTKSNNVILATKGWVESKGYKAVLKPERMFAIRSSDHLLKLKLKVKL